MNASPTLLQKKYSRIIEKYAEKANISLQEALDVFYNSKTYRLIDEGVSDIHCMSDEYLVKELQNENI